MHFQAKNTLKNNLYRFLKYLFDVFIYKKDISFYFSLKVKLFFFVLFLFFDNFFIFIKLIKSY
jgi:hypothetical protein